MANWYFSDSLQQRHGPISVEHLRDAYARGEIHANTMIWTEGFPNWVTLASMGPQLGIATPPMAGPPALGMQGRVLLQPAKSNGCVMAMVIAAVVAVPLLAILAAIAIPAYQEFTVRAQVSGAIASLSAARGDADAFYEQEQRCPNDDELTFTLGEATKKLVLEQRASTLDGGECELHMRIQLPGANGIKTLTQTRGADGEWSFSSDVPSKYLPMSMR